MPYQFFTAAKFNAQLVTLWLLMDEEARCELRTYVLTLRLKE